MPSRLLIGAAGWLLGAVTATAGSLYAVDQLGQGLVDGHTKRVSVAMVNNELAQENSERPIPAAARSQSPSPRPSVSASRSVRAAGTVPGKPPHQHSSAGLGLVMSTTGGTAEAECQPGGAYLVYVSPAQGYDVHHLQRGPAPAASVTFANSTGGVALRVTCTSSGDPVKHVSAFSSGSGSRDD